MILITLAVLTLFPNVGGWVIRTVAETIDIEAGGDDETVGGYVGGITATLIAAATGLILAGTFLLTRNEARREAVEAQASRDREHFFRMLEFHRQNVAEIDVADLQGKRRSKGRRAFVVFKIQFHYLHEAVREALNEHAIDPDHGPNRSWIIDFLYVAFYYGIDRKWPDFIKSKLRMDCPYQPHGEFDLLYERLMMLIEGSPYKLGRTNQTRMSAYFRNLFGAVKFVDESEVLAEKEKQRLVKMLRGQLSNPELYIFFFNAVSRFGQEWHGYIKKYQLLKNLPFGYIEEYDQSNFFKQDYEEYGHGILRGWSREFEYPI